MRNQRTKWRANLVMSLIYEQQALLGSLDGEEGALCESTAILPAVKWIFGLSPTTMGLSF